MEVALCLTADYGQIAAAREIEAARNLSAHYEVPHQVVDLPFIKEVSNTALFGETPLPKLPENALDDREVTKESARAVWVPNRNGVLINVAACFAEARDCQCVVAGFNREEGATFPDNSPGFVDAVNALLSYSTLNQVRLVSYTLHLDKTEIVDLGKRLGLPWNLIWSCYCGGDEPCGVCESCLRLRRALDNG
jgi:7-cyano-7-deazaguanine synthase